MILQIKQAGTLFTEVAQLGIVFSLLVAIILVLGWLVVKLYKEGKEKSKAHGEAMALKDKKIEDITEARRQDAIDTVTFVKELQQDIKLLVNSIDKLL